MANTYTQIHLQIVIAVKYRAGLIHPQWQQKLHRYMSGIVQKNGHKMITINSMPDHLHMLIGQRPNQSLSELMRLVKCDSSEWVNKTCSVKSRFSWQNGYGAFSYAKSHIARVATYIEQQQKHHAKINFIDEYLAMLKVHDVEFDPRFIFQDLQ